MSYYIWNKDQPSGAARASEFETRSALVEHLRVEKDWSELTIKKIVDGLREDDYCEHSVTEYVQPSRRYGIESLVAVAFARPDPHNYRTTTWCIAGEDHVKPIKEEYRREQEKIQAEERRKIEDARRETDRWVEQEEDDERRLRLSKRIKGAARGLRPIKPQD